MKTAKSSTVPLQQSSWDQVWPAPAKINRFLHIIGQRQDGYHLLQSVFQLVDYCDFLRFSSTSDDAIQIETTLENVEPQQNLVFKAARLLQQHCSISTGVKIFLEKNIATGAGLGGGSSDAATTLLALNQLWKCQLSTPELCTLGLQLGADVPFFIHGSNAFVEGIGEKITPLQIDCPWLLLAIPDCHISTADIFSNADLTRATPEIQLKQLQNLENSTENRIQLNGFGRNDCEELVIKSYADVKTAHNWLKLSSNPRLTGTGSCLFSTFTNQQRALEVNLNAPAELSTIVTSTLSESPITALLKQFCP